MLMTAEEFALAWGAESLVRLPSDRATAPIPRDACAFLMQAGLPALISYANDLKITFCRLASGPSPFLDEPSTGPPLPPEWSVYLIMGDEFFCNGSASWCIDERSGQVVRIDIELNHPLEFANSSVAHFASAIQAAALWSAECGESAGEWPAKVDEFRQELTMLDPTSMDSDQNFWPMYLNFIRGEGSHVGAFEKGSRLEGEQVLKAGPW